MRTIYAEPSELPGIISDYLKKGRRQTPGPLFVFSSDVAADSWSEWAVRNPEESGVQAVALEDFTAWDKFKIDFLAGSAGKKNCIPAVLRKLFVRSLIHQNLSGHFITKIIPHEKSDAQAAYAFTDWLARILPSLKLWHQKYQAYLAAQGITPSSDPDTENRDYNELFTRYKNFLDGNNFFEPAWLSPEFIEKERTIIILYPELLEDFAEYTEVFSLADNVTAVMLPELSPGAERPGAYRYADSRTELRRTILRLRALHESGVPWTSMALSVPDMETYRPYIKREFERYCVPVNIRSGEPLTQNCAGLIFSRINDCYAENFSYDSVRSLLQNEYVPWNSEAQTVKENLIREGNRLHALCSYEESPASDRLVDTWMEALDGIPADTRERIFYERLRHEVTCICEAKSFRALHTAWLTFRENFLDTENFSSGANRILGRCISELNDIMDIEARYIKDLNLTVEKPFAFFLSELQSKTYRPQEVIDGVSVFPYKLSAAGAIKHQFVIDASQANLDIPYKKLNFLSNEKRKSLLGQEAEESRNSSEAFIRLYGKFSAQDDVIFSCAAETFSGFAIAHNALSVRKDADPLQELDKTDFIKREENLILNADGNSSLKNPVSIMQRDAFTSWLKRTKGFDATMPYSPGPALKEAVEHAVVTRRKSNGKPVITQSDMRNFFPCPRRWIFSGILKCREDSLSMSLMQPYDIGNINHKILELYIGGLLKKGGCLPVAGQDGTFENNDGLREEIRRLTDEAIHDTSMSFKSSPLVIHILESQAESIAADILNFLGTLCRPPEYPKTVSSRTRIKGFGGYKVAGAELEIESQTGQGVSVLGKIDCLLSDPVTGDFVIIDYKNSSFAMPRAADVYPDSNGILADFQMPMYVTLVQNERIKRDSGIKIQAAYFYAIKDGKNLGVIDEYTGLPSGSPEGAANNKSYGTFCDITLSSFGNYAKKFEESIGSSDFSPVNPADKMSALINVEPHRTCVQCDFKSICRTTFTVGAQEIARG